MKPNGEQTFLLLYKKSSNLKSKSVKAHIVKPRHYICSIFALDDGLLVLSIPVLKLSLELDGDDLQVAWIMVPGEVTVHTNHIHKGSLDKIKSNLEIQSLIHFLIVIKALTITSTSCMFV